MFESRLVQEKSGTDARQAEQLERQRKREVAAGTYQPGTGPGGHTFTSYAESFFKGRKNITKDDEEARIRNHVLPSFGDRPLDQIETSHLLSLVQGLEGKLAPKSIRHIYGTLVTMFRRAVRDRLIVASPCLLEKHELPSPHELGQNSREPGAYTLAEAVALMTDERIRVDRRVVYVVALLTGMRHGEIAGLRWRDIDTGVAPLWRINLRTQKDGQALKTRKPREIPVHPVLRAVLDAWKRSGCGSFMLRDPKVDDLVVPTERGTIRHEHTSLDLLQRDAARIGIPARRFHDLRHTHISITQDAGAPPHVVELWTHAAKMRVIDRYTHLHWQTKCEALLKLRIVLTSLARERTGLAVTAVSKRARRRSTSRAANCFARAPFGYRAACSRRTFRVLWQKPRVDTGRPSISHEPPSPKTAPPGRTPLRRPSSA